MGLLENKHVKERELFCRLLTNTEKASSVQEQASMCTPQERNSKMAELRDTRNKSVNGKVYPHHLIKLNVMYIILVLNMLCTSCSK